MPEEVKCHINGFNSDDFEIDQGHNFGLVSRFEFADIDLVITPLMANQSLASESERARHQYSHDPAGQSGCFVSVSRLQKCRA